MQGLPQSSRTPPNGQRTRPARLGKYEILERIGEGGFGRVYKGFDPLIQRFVAIKTCTSPEGEVRQRYTQEARIAGQLDHPNIVRIFDFGIDDGTPFLVQEFLSGEDLDEQIAKRAFVPQPERLLYLIHIARGLHYAHSKGVIHRDIKPANIRILDDGTAKIMDFGVATLQHSQTRLTKAGTTMGTAAYLAPEQIRGDPLDGRTDIFSFGILAYELVTGERPFGQETISAILYEILNDDPRPITLPASVCPEGLRQLIFRCLEKEPDRRYSDCAEIVEALESVRETMKVEARARDLTTALRRSSSGPPRAQASDPVDPGRPSRGVIEESEDFEPVIRHEWTPAGIAIPKRRLVPGRVALGVTALLAGAGAWFWLGIHGRAPWPAHWSATGDASPLVSWRPADGVTAAPPSREIQPTEQPVTPALSAAAESSPGSELQQRSGTPDATTRGTGAPASVAEVAATDTEPAEAEDPAAEAAAAPTVVEEATLTLPASWHPDTTVAIDNSRPVRLSTGRTLRLPPGAHKALFSLSTSEYSTRQTVRLELQAGEQRTLRSPIQPPGQLTVQASLGSPQGLVAVDGDLIGSSPLRGKALSPGSHLLELYAQGGPEAPLASTRLDIDAGEETVVTFDLTGRQELSVRSRRSHP